jgi:hypothetical protein
MSATVISEKVSAPSCGDNAVSRSLCRGRGQVLPLAQMEGRKRRREGREGGRERQKEERRKEGKKGLFFP